MFTTMRRPNPATDRATVTRRIDAPVESVWALLADVHAWPRWGPFSHNGTSDHIDRPGFAHPIRLGRRQLQVALTSPDAPYWIRYRLTSGPVGAQHSAEVILSPTDDGGTELRWQATPTHDRVGISRRRAAITSAVTDLAAHLASAAEDQPTTRAEWSHQTDRPLSRADELAA